MSEVGGSDPPLGIPSRGKSVRLIRACVHAVCGVRTNEIAWAGAFPFPFCPQDVFPIPDRVNPSETNWFQVEPSESKRIQVKLIKRVQVIPSEPKWVQASPREAKRDRVSPCETKRDQVRPSDIKWGQVSSCETKWDQVSLIKCIQTGPSVSSDQVRPHESKGVSVSPSQANYMHNYM